MKTIISIWLIFLLVVALLVICWALDNFWLILLVVFGIAILNGLFEDEGKV